MFKTVLFVASAIALAAAHGDHDHTHPPTSEKIEQAIVKLEGNGVVGEVLFKALPNDLVQITGKVDGMPPGLYGFHIHEKGDMVHGCGSMGGHFNPNHNDHGHPSDENRHVGDLGNIVFDDSKSANINFTDHQIKLEGRQSIIGRGLVLHEGEDDYGKTDHPDSKKTGNAGARVACGVIGILDTVPVSSANSIGTSKIITISSIMSLVTMLPIS